MANTKDDEVVKSVLGRYFYSEDIISMRTGAIGARMLIQTDQKQFVVFGLLLLYSVLDTSLLIYNVLVKVGPEES